MKISSNIFKPYYIRGLYPRKINEEIVESIGRAFVGFLRKKYKKKKVKIAIGQDNRISSFSLYQALKKGILEQGGEVVVLGLSPTPMFYFAVWKFHYDGGIQITASHLPPQYNGCKLVSRGAVLIGGDSGLKEIEKRVLYPPKFCKVKHGRASKQNVLAEYLKFIFKHINLKQFKDFKIAIDTGNAVSGILIKEFKKYFPGKVYHLFPELDGRFPNHLLNPLEEKNIEDLKKVVKEKKLDLGIALDGDGDRIIFVDEKGKMISPDFITCLLSEILLKKAKKEKIIYTLCSSNIIKDIVAKNNGLAIPWKIGHNFIKAKMKREKAILGGEYSGHYFLKDTHFFEAPLYILLKILEKISTSKKSILELILDYKKYFYSGIINFRVENKEEKIIEIERRFQKGKVSYLDGLRIDFPDYWFSIRLSHTENLLRVVAEAKSESLLKEKLDEIKKIIKNPA